MILETINYIEHIWAFCFFFIIEGICYLLTILASVSASISQVQRSRYIGFVAWEALRYRNRGTSGSLLWRQQKPRMFGKQDPK